MDARCLPVVLRCDQTTLNYFILRYWFKFNAVYPFIPD